MIDSRKIIKGVIISSLALVIVINVALIVINQALIAEDAFNYCTNKVYENVTKLVLEECLRVQSLKSAPVFTLPVILIVISSIIIIELTARQLTRKKLKKRLSRIKEENELMATPLTAALFTRHLLGIPCHIWDLAFCVGFIIGSLVGTGLLQLVCVLMSIWCGLGAVIDYRKFKELWKRR